MEASKKIKCIAINPAITPDGKRRTQITFGRELDPMKHSTPQGMPIAYDNDAIVFLEEEFYKQVKKKLVVGEEYTLSASEQGITIRF